MIRRTFSDIELLNGISNGDASALNWLYTEYFQKVEHFVKMNRGKSSDAHDVFQEAVIVLWHNVKTGDFRPSPSGIGPYLMRVARNKWIDHLRSAGFRHTVALNGATETLRADEESSSEENKLLDTLEAMLSAIGEKCKSILTAFYFDNQSLRVIAEEHCTDEDSMRTMKYRCMMKLKQKKNELESKEEGKRNE